MNTKRITLFSFIFLALFAAPAISAAEPLRAGLVPLDNRPPCFSHVVKLGKIAGLQPSVPPYSAIGAYIFPGNPDALLDWLEAEAPRLDVLILSVEMATAGGLVPSRVNGATLEDVERRLARIESIAAKNPHLKIWAYGILQRIARTGTGDPETDKVTALISRYVAASDEAEATGNRILSTQAAQLKRLIPAAELENYLTARKRNHEANRRMIDMAARGIFETLVIGMDDNAVYGPHRKERIELEALINTLGARGRIFIKPGADELAQLMMLRAALESAGASPEVFVAAADPSVLKSIPPLEDRPLDDSITLALQLAGARRAFSPSKNVPALFVHNNSAMNEKDAGMIAGLVKRGVRVSVADVADINSGSAQFVNLLGGKIGDLSALAGYAGWNTASNALGTAIAELLAGGLANTPAQKKLHLSFLFERFADDALFMGGIRPALQKQDFPGNYDGERYTAMRAQLVESLRAESSSFFSNYFSRCGYKLNSINLNIPWFRLFEIDVDAALE